ncbi:MAG TPA: hypothetical protein VM243_02320 [Phycisphaerae bacterium]|nr:hypothetical protein [Phycisphaerae bacterium]
MLCSPNSKDVNATTVDAAGAIMKSLLLDQSFIAAISAGVPVNVALAPNTLFGRGAGDVGALTAAQVVAVLKNVLGVSPTSGMCGLDSWTGGQYATSTKACVADRIMAVPFRTLGQTISALGVYVSVAGGVGDGARLGLYEWDDTDNEPGALLQGGAEIDLDATGNKWSSLAGYVAGPGKYFLAIQFEASAGEIQARQTVGAGLLPVALPVSLLGTYCHGSSAYAAGLPNPFPAVTMSTNTYTPNIRPLVP